MSSDLSSYLASAIMNWMRGTTFPAAPSNVYVALFNGNPTVAGTSGTEVTTSVRAAGRLAAGFAAISGGKIANAANVDFGLSAAGATITHIAIFSAASGGNMLGFKALPTALPVVTGDPVLFEAGKLTFAVSDPF